MRRKIPRINPKIPDTKVITTLSNKIWFLTSAGFAPKARRIPISLVRSVTVINKMLEMAITPARMVKVPTIIVKSFSRNGKKATYTLTGDYPIGNKISQKKLIYGRYINDADVSGSKNVIVIGEEIYKNFFDAKKNENPLGKSVNVKGIFFQVIGVFRAQKGGGPENDQSSYIPLSTFTKMYNDGDKVGFFAIVSKPDADLGLVSAATSGSWVTTMIVFPPRFISCSSFIIS